MRPVANNISLNAEQKLLQMDISSAMIRAERNG